MLGAIAGDVIGSVHEHSATKTTEFELFAKGCSFTDDTVLAVAVADCLLNGRDYVDAFHQYFLDYPRPATAADSSVGPRQEIETLTTAGATVRQCGCPQWDMRSPPSRMCLRKRPGAPR